MEEAEEEEEEEETAGFVVGGWLSAWTAAGVRCGVEGAAETTDMSSHAADAEVEAEAAVGTPSSLCEGVPPPSLPTRRR